MGLQRGRHTEQLSIHTHTHMANINLFLACIRDYITEKETLNIKKGKQLIVEYNLQVFSYIQHEVGKIFLQKMRK